MNNMMTTQTLADRLHAAGLRATGPRMAILRFLEQDRTHPSAERVHEALAEQLPSLSLSTVYSTLESFLDRGLLRRVQTPEGRMRVDGTVQDHDHAICRACGAVFDVQRQQGDRPARTPEFPHGVRLVDVHVEYEVLCAACDGNGAPTEYQDPGGAPGLT